MWISPGTCGRGTFVTHLWPGHFWYAPVPGALLVCTCGRGFLSVRTCGRGTCGRGFLSVWTCAGGFYFVSGLFCWRVNLYSRAKRILVYWPAAVIFDYFVNMLFQINNYLGSKNYLHFSFFMGLAEHRQPALTISAKTIYEMYGLPCRSVAPYL